MAAEVEIVGGAAAQADIKRWAAQLGPAIGTAGHSYATALAEEVAGKVPVFTGNLAASVTADDELGSLGVGMGEGLEYAGWIEFGGDRGRDLVPEGRYLYPTALDAEQGYYELAEKTATDTIESFSWNKP